jgi:hypothetical protein
MAETQSGWSPSDYQQRLLIALYCHHNTSACVDEMVLTAVIDALYQEFIQMTRSSLTRTEVYSKLRELESAGLFGVVSCCLKCNQLRCNVKAYLCPRCADKVRGVSTSYLPPLRKTGSLGGGGSQVGWHPNRQDEPSPWQEKAIRDMEELPE